MSGGAAQQDCETTQPFNAREVKNIVYFSFVHLLFVV